MRGRTGHDHISIQIEQKLNSLNTTPQDHFIFKVPYKLRKGNEKAYEPEILSIGPYHHNKSPLLAMQHHKLLYLKQLLQRRNEKIDEYVKAMRDLEQATRKCYAEQPISDTEDEFVEMMLLDGCFIVELFRKYGDIVPRDEHDLIFKHDWLKYAIERDIKLAENQLPFFVLNKLFQMTQASNERHDLIDLGLHFFGRSLPVLSQNIDQCVINSTKHLLSMLHDTLCPKIEQNNKGHNWKFIRCATELKLDGIKFEKEEKGDRFDIKFKNGKLKISPLEIIDEMESLLRNLMAYEQNCRDIKQKVVTDYVIFMDCLINSPEDVKLLRKIGIIENRLGEDEAVSTMFNSLGQGITISNFCYAGVFEEVNCYCMKRRNLWMAKLRSNHFNSPWATLSLLGAILLIVLAAVQTVFTVLSYCWTVENSKYS